MLEDKISDKLSQTIQICRIHADRMQDALESISHLLPITADKYLSMTNEHRAYLDQYIFRFAKLQDAIGEKLFKSVLVFVGEDTSKMSFKDILLKLSKLEIIQDTDAWLNLRELRNDASHDYPAMIDEAILSLNEIINSKDHLISYLNSCIRYLRIHDMGGLLKL